MIIEISRRICNIDCWPPTLRRRGESIERLTLLLQGVGPSKSNKIKEAAGLSRRL
jgi:hypothetical protein